MRVLLFHLFRTRPRASYTGNGTKINKNKGCGKREEEWGD